MSQNTSVLIVGTRFCHQRSHFYSYHYRCPEMKFRRTQLSGGSASTWTRWSGPAGVLSNDTVEI